MYGFGINRAAWSKDSPDVAYLLEWLEMPSIDGKDFYGVYHDTAQGVWEEIQDYDDQTKVRPCEARPLPPTHGLNASFRAQGTFMPPGIVLVGILMGAADGLKFMHDNKCALSPPRLYPPPLPTPRHARARIHAPCAPAPAAGSTGTSSPRTSAPLSSRSSRSGPYRAMEVCALSHHCRASMPARRRAPLFERTPHQAIIAPLRRSGL